MELPHGQPKARATLRRDGVFSHLRPAGKRSFRWSESGLTYAQVFLLVVGFGFASGVIFLFGLWVGRDIAERRLAQEERIVRLPVPAQPTPAQEEPVEEEASRAFYERMKQKAEERLQEAPAAQPGEQIPSTPLATRGIQPTLTAPRLVVFPTEARPTMPVGRPTPRATFTRRPNPTPTAAVASNDNGWADAGWTVQVNATTDLEEARQQAQRLRMKGFDAYTVQAPTRGGPTWYRIRVGRFSNREKARARELENRLREEGMTNAYTTPQ